MDIQLEKYKLMEWLINLKDESIISELMSVKNRLSTSSDWTADVSEAEKLLIDRGLQDIEEGKTYTHEQVMEEINKAYEL